MLKNNLSEVVYIDFRPKSECDFITWSRSASACRPRIRNQKANKFKKESIRIRFLLIVQRTTVAGFGTVRYRYLRFVKLEPQEELFCLSGTGSGI
jgi:hypothetical protein